MRGRFFYGDRRGLAEGFDDEGIVGERLCRCYPGLLAIFGALLLICVAASAAPLPPQARVAAESSNPSRSVPLTKVGQVHDLSVEQALQSLPVHLRGTVTVNSAWKDSFFLQDSTGAIAVERMEHSPLHAGDRVELSGYSQPGGFAPSVREEQVRVLGRAALPKTRLYTYAELADGLQDSLWVETQGVVQSARTRPYWSRTVLELKIGVPGGMFTARMLDYKPGDEQGLVDATVRIHGVCGALFNDKRQLTGILLFVDSRREVDVLHPSPADPYALPLSSLNGIMQFKPGAPEDHRIRVSGIVTYQEPGRMLYVQDGTDGLMLQTEQSTRVPLGTRIEAIGFSGSGGYAPILRNAVFRPTQTGEKSAPVPIRASMFYKPQIRLANDPSTIGDAPYNSRLVRIQGTVLESIARLNDHLWLLRDGKDSFTIWMKQGPNGPAVPMLQNGSVVSVTGIFLVQVDEENQPQTFRILLRGPGDLLVLRHAPWWTQGHAVKALALLLAVTFGTVLWVVLLRRQVRQQTHRLRESEDRFRKQAQHDTLTGLASRSYLQERMRLAVAHAAERGQKLGILMIDLDHFKQVNDTLGHHAGDELLCAVAERIQRSVRKSDLVARIGGDEFVVLLTDLYDCAEAELIGAKVVANVSVPLHLTNRQVFVSASVGICMYPEGGASGEALLQSVDAAMYNAKAAGRNSFSVYPARAAEEVRLPYTGSAAGINRVALPHA